MSNRELIGVVGRKQHGKDSVGKVLESVGYRLDAFAKPIKDAVGVMLGMTHAQLYGDLKEAIDERYGVTPRHAMQTLGTEWGREMIHDEVWVRAALARHEGEYVVPNRGTVITDARFKNEAELIRQAGGILVYVTRPGLLDNEFSDHGSERDIDEIGMQADYHVINDGSLIDLQEAVLALKL